VLVPQREPGNTTEVLPWITFKTQKNSILSIAKAAEDHYSGEDLIGADDLREFEATCATVFIEVGGPTTSVAH
jgi:hypothetical protein